MLSVCTTIYYDFTDRLTKYVESGADFYHSVSYVYSDADENGELKTLVETINDARITTGYNYDTDNRVTGVVHTINLDEDAEAEATVSRGYQYDAYGRLSKRIAGNGTATPVVTDELIYRGVTLKRIDPETHEESDVLATSGQVNTLKITSTQGGYSILYTYTYDANGNITSVNDGTYTTYYFYDSQNQLIRENSEATGKSRVWTYDGAGNITSRKEYTYINNAAIGNLLSTVQYGYTNSTWGDLLTNYNGQAFTYDAVGNLTFDGTWGYTWEHGRQLKSMTGSSTTWNFTYNADGLRTGRTNGTTTYSYVYNGSQLSQMTVGSNVLYFTYDASGIPLSVTCNGATYYYVTNLQGDVSAILNSSGTAVVLYTYDAWGNILTTTGSMATTLGTLNPLRYRGYVYDAETGLYYLQSRYYNPELGRFINADAYVSTGQGFVGNNMFAYCGNNPVNCSDPSGYCTCAAGGLKSTFANSNRCPTCDYALGAIGGGVGIACLLKSLSGAIGRIADTFSDWLDEQKNAVVQKVTQSLARSKRKHSNDSVHNHHIVPQNDLRGLPAYIILQEVFPDYGVNDPRNIVPVSSRIHVRLHSDEYYFLVNCMVTIAYLSAGDNASLKEANVTAALADLKVFISVLELL